MKDKWIHVDMCEETEIPVYPTTYKLFMYYINSSPCFFFFFLLPINLFLGKRSAVLNMYTMINQI